MQARERTGEYSHGYRHREPAREVEEIDLLHATELCVERIRLSTEAQVRGVVDLVCAITALRKKRISKVAICTGSGLVDRIFRTSGGPRSTHLANRPGMYTALQGTYLRQMIHA